MACQIREHLHLNMPGYASLFHNFFAHEAAMAVARKAGSAQAVLGMDAIGLKSYLTEQKIRFQNSTIEKILALAKQAAKLEQVESQPLHHSIWTDLHDLYQSIEKRIVRLEADLAGVMGSISHYANANAVTGRSGLYPSRYQSDQTDNSGTIVRTANRRLRATWHSLPL
jgi:hypothetical protein